MIKELSFDDDGGIYSVERMNDEDDLLTDSKIPPGKFAKIIDEFETVKDDFDDNEFKTAINGFGDDNEDDITLDSLGLR